MLNGPVRLTFAALSITALLTVNGFANSVTFVGTNNSDLAASAEFDLTGTTLKITLTNTATVAAASNATVLTGLFWNSDEIIGGTFSSIALGPGSVVVPHEWNHGDYNVGMFGYGNHVNGPGGRQNGIGSAGFVKYDQTLLPSDAGFTGTAPPNSPDGPAGGLIPFAAGASSVNKPVVRNAETWTITSVNPNFSLNQIENVFFQYGTALSEPGIPGEPGVGTPPPLPLPAAVWGGMGVLAVLGVSRKLRGKTAF